jgi:ABC-type polar amino acid transport system ATPase subunit
MTEPGSVAIALRGVNKWFGGFQALKSIDLQVHKGERVVICGPSGSGKSTLIRCVNGLEQVQQGSIVVDGITLDGSETVATEVRRRVGMVFQQFNLFPHLTVAENCMLAPRWARGLARPQARERALQYPGQLSGGQQQRVAIARALCMEPDIMLFDEPTSALDPEMVKEVLDTMLMLAGDGITMVCVTHEMGFARAASDRIVFMDCGEIVEENSPQAFFESPRSERTRQFIGQILSH